MARFQRIFGELFPAERTPPVAPPAPAGPGQADLSPLALTALAATVASLEQYAIEGEKEETSTYRAELAALRKEIAENAGEEVLAALPARLTGLLAQHKNRIDTCQQQRDADLQQILGALSEAASTLVSRNDKHNTYLKGFTSDLQSIAQNRDLASIRSKLAQQVVQLREASDRMWRENQGAVDHLSKQVEVFQERLEVAEVLASTDELTGLLNRRAGMAKLEQKVNAGRPFCLYVLDLNCFKSINDTYGHAAGDQVLRTFAEKLRLKIRPADTVCRWGGDEFVVLAECELAVAIQRSRQIADAISGNYAIACKGSETSIRVTASLGVAEIRAGETGEQLFARADAALYKAKADRSGSGPAPAAVPPRAG